ncbi:hypothetical protein Raf01_34370 [Rugosimonospora africana]|uniref:Secreted protein n=1 Tax=Rugosimonospora africana TaxID=556532 RepID=A0A8J3VQL7_9ACTN|nr:hypothetical protein Raf01_34370 [Rugosimonospora africana]
MVIASVATTATAAQAATAPVLSASALSVMTLTDAGSFPTITGYRAADEASSRPFSVVRMSTLIAGGYATRAVCHPTDLTVTSAVAGFCWDSTDDTTTKWYPQGVTGSGDGMNGTTLYPPCDGCAGRKVVAVSWHSGAGYAPYGNDGLARVTFADVTNGDTGAPYRHALLVEPDGTAAGYHAIASHADGILWYGDKLILVTGGDRDASGAGRVVRVFDLTHFWQMSSTTSGAVGCTATACSAAYSLFALPEVGYYQFPDGAICDPLRNGTAASLTHPCLDSISLDRSTSPASVITTEYDDQGPQGRILRWPLDAETATAPLKPDADGYVRPDQGWTSPVYRMQGAAFTGIHGVVEGLCPNGAPPVSSMPDDPAHDAVIHGFAKSCLHKATISADGSLDVHYWTTTMENAENVSYWPSSGELWVMNEFRGSTDTQVSPPVAYPGDRLVLAIHCPDLTCS